MPDITMCRGLDVNGRMCPKAKTCYRYTARPSVYNQSWFTHAPFKLISAKTTECEHEVKAKGAR